MPIELVMIDDYVPREFTSLTVMEAADLMNQYSIDFTGDLEEVLVDVEDIMKEYTNDPRAETYTGGNQIDHSGCGVNGVCAGCPQGGVEPAICGSSENG